ncbi:Glycerophosphoryl diester phosphodiesterase family-domain-containing protein [Xylaria bambusicola]|uniref:Glycerophosphoryl diester phosphodiesterase family-domain-containing protein n=1 Tax=Xylaria bambusicola TaxID=326684 RepID=UPI002007D1F9|nr:Glycerophosphoryl diester phosphodiesterase family-domain-containing protein [Xylaria bambusicola]KAI0514815.1 Glycerophosphoryl diester phosphodiesterase family-domain-containing protein [Xylaria bambusicola]
MRFGRDYHQRFVPDWSGFYVRYDLIKCQLKSTTHAFDSSLQLLSDDIGAFISFHVDRVTDLAYREASLWTLFDESQQTGVFHSYERKFLVSEFNSLVQELLKIQWFDRVNQEAIDRLFQKFHRVASQSGSSHDAFASLRTRWTRIKQTQQLNLSEIENRLQSNIAREKKRRDTDEWTDSSLPTAVRGLSVDGPLFRDALYKALNGTEPDASTDLLALLTSLSEADFLQLSRSLFVFFVIRRSWRNAITLVEHITSRKSLTFAENHMQLLITVHFQEMNDSEAGTSAITTSNRDDVRGAFALDVFARILQSLEPASTEEFTKGKVDERVPLLHSLAKHGLLEWCRLALQKIQEAKGKLDVKATILSMDRLKLTPLHYALIHHNFRVVDLLVDKLVNNIDECRAPDCQAILGSCLSLAVVLGKKDVVAQISPLTNLDIRSTYGISALHLASRDGNVGIIAHLLQAGASIDVSEHPRGWTPLFEAAVNGCMEAVQYLIEHDANATLVDCVGWTAKELATYRGHLAIAELLDSVNSIKHSRNIIHAPRPTINLLSHGAINSGDIIVSVNLGPMQVGRNSPAVQLSYFSKDPTGATESLFNLRVSAAGQTHHIRLPILDDRSNVPLVFGFPQNADLHVAFKIFRDDPEKGEEGMLVCGGTAVLESNRLLFGPTRQSLVREHTVPVLDSMTLDITGSILFTYVIAKPFPHLQSPKYSVTELNASESSVTIIGHRGLGQNVDSQQHLQIGENTVESFIAAASAGASFVELMAPLDVQVTKDLKPVIYHDFSLSETGTDIPIHDTTVDQYRYTSSIQASQPVPDINTSGDGVNSASAETRPRSRSLTSGNDPGVFYMQDRLRHTVDFKTKGMKSNIRGRVIQQPLATLKDLFHKLPNAIGFNIEIKYPRFHETVAARVAPIGPELNLFVDTVLEQVHLYGGSRRIILSSFTPEICMLLSVKQKAYPVMFITNAGKLPMIDVERRAASMQVAVHFAKLWDLAGIVFASEPLVLCPRLVRYVKSSGLVCASYGPQNSLPDAVIAQVRAGIDILIVDRVGLVAKTLKELTP